ncbi:MAG: sigma-70 family RNA polymerase sigma factor [Ruminiclostridium sp.]|nr:sigma-70 family RNA polymerase sigma factor [Ruminiclostridium sp.]
MTNADRIAEFTENYMEKLFYFCLKKTGNETEAQDLTQDIALNVLTALNKGIIPTSFSAWVWRIARNRYSVWADKKHKRNESVTGSDIADYDEIRDENGDIPEKIQHGEQLSLLRRELAFIREDYRSIVVAYYIEDRSVRDIARSLSLSENAVQQRLHRARTILKEGLDMAREFGQLSYKPENISFISNGIGGADGEPWCYLNRLLCKNIMLAAYRNPASAEELAVEVGVALPYMEEELNGLVNTSLMKKNGKKYETNFFIVSAQAQEKIFAHLRGIAPELTGAVIETLECAVSLKNEHCPHWHEGYQPYEDMKWALLMDQVDLVDFDTLDAFRADRKTEPNAGVGKWGHTIRPNGGEWDVLGMELFRGERPVFVGLHGCVHSVEERNLPYIDFRQFKFQYRGIAGKTPSVLPHAYAQALLAAAKGELDTVEPTILERLTEYGYLEKKNGKFQPTFLVMFEDRGELPPDAEEKVRSLRKKAVDAAMRHYLFCREQIEKEIPEFLKNDAFQIDHACANIFSLRGAVLEEALRQGYLEYGENDGRKMLGAELRI